MYNARADNVTILKIDALFAYVSGKEPPAKTGEPHQCFITHIHYAGFNASVEMVEESCHGIDYVNYFYLIKTGGLWLIVSKTYDAVVRG